MRILFVSRAYPPIVGGIENQNHALSEWLPRLTSTTTIANRHGKKFLPLFFPFALIRALSLLPRFDLLLLGDGVLAPLGWCVKLCSRKKTIVSILHGLDITYAQPLYQKLWVRFFLPRLDGFIAVSQATKALAMRSGLREDRIRVIPNGIHLVERVPADRPALERKLGQSLTGKIILMSAGRLVPRKGVRWFLETVFPQLPERFVFVMAGDGPERSAIAQSIERLGLSTRAFLLGRVSDTELHLLHASANLFIQPNRPMPNDIEGFGIAVLEASAAGLPVVATRLEGLAEAISDGRNGFLVPPENAPALIEAILAHEHDRERLGADFARFTREHFTWSVIVDQYLAVLTDFERSTRDAH